jgi:hypothetical protein
MTLLWAFEFSEGRDSGGEKIPVDLHNYAQVSLFLSACYND